MRIPRTAEHSVRVVMVLALGIVDASACAPPPSGPRPFVVACTAVFPDPVETGGEEEPIGKPPTIRNWGELMGQLRLRYDGRIDRTARVQVLVQPDGRASRGCVRERSGSLSYDRLALSVARGAIFRPALDAEGEPIEAWSIFDVSVVVR